MEFRQYQKDMIAAGIKGFTAGKPFIIQAAAGSGKSIVIAGLADELNEPILVLAPTKEIVEQNYAKMLLVGVPDVKMYSASVGKKEIGRITIATIQSIYKKPELFKHFRHIIVDEVHNVSPKNIKGTYMKFFRDIGTTKICGLSATPFRLETKFALGNNGMVYTGTTQMLNRITKETPFKSIVYKIGMKELIEQGYLARTEYHTYETDLSDLITNTTGKDYTSESLEDWGDSNLKQMVKLAPELDAKHNRVLVFCSSLRQARRAQEALRPLGIDAEVIDGMLPKKEREAMLRRFSVGETKWVINMGVLTTGYDNPALDSVMMMRPTYSVPLYIQIAGRAQRIDPENPNKVAHFYDLSGTVDKFGRPEEIRIEKEDGFKDMLVGERGRIDNVALFTFDAKEKAKKIKKPVAYADLARLI